MIPWTPLRYWFINRRAEKELLEERVARLAFQRGYQKGRRDALKFFKVRKP